jgi:arginyl-tRNA synthetase
MEKNPDLPDKETVARQVGVGAVIFNKLYNSRIKDTHFSWERMLSFDGETGPYVQYTHARACSMLEKAGPGAEIREFDGKYLSDGEAFEVIKILYDYPRKIIEAAEKYEPFVISRALVALAQSFNRFYHAHTVLTDDKNTRDARLALTDAVRAVLSGGLRLLGIESPARM